MHPPGHPCPSLLSPSSLVSLPIAPNAVRKVVTLYTLADPVRPPGQNELSAADLLT